MLNNEKKSLACRPREHLITAAKLYPNAWRLSDTMRADRGQKGAPDWPDWCYLPMAGWYAIVSADAGVERLGMDRIGDVAKLAAIGSWRVTQGIYRFDPAVYAAVIDTPITGDIPCDVLYRLPEWATYIETPFIELAGAPLHGIWAHLEFDANTNRTELRLLVDSDIALFPIVLHLGPWSLAESINRAMAESARQAQQTGLRHIADALADTDVVAVMRPAIAPIMSLLLYLCSQNAEIGNGDIFPKNPQPIRTKNGPRLFAPDNPRTWDVGVRLGAALRRAYQAAETNQGGTHVSARGHVRRMHWHGFWSGPKKREDGTELRAIHRRFDVRWMPPIAVNLTDFNDLPATIRKVGKVNS
jgi:hypothetical protein